MTDKPSKFRIACPGDSANIRVGDLSANAVSVRVSDSKVVIRCESCGEEETIG